MTKEERTALKTEIVAELGRHLDEHYVRKDDMKTAAMTLTKIVAEPLGELVAKLDERISDVETTVAKVTLSSQVATEEDRS